jgi:hypothetical protein
MSPTVTAPSRRTAVQQAATRTGTITHVPRVAPLDVGVFRAFAKGGVPFVMVGMVEHWPLAQLSPQQLKPLFGDLRVRARTGDYVEKAFSAQRSMCDLSLAEYLDLVVTNPSALPAYLGNQQLPALNTLCRWPPYFEKPATPRMWLGPAGTVTPLHCDFDDNLFAQIWGSKRFVLYPPHHGQYLYTREANPVLYASKFDPDAPDYESMPLARQAQPLECIVQPGELLFLPAGWYHQVRALEFSLSANLWGKDRPLALQP